MFITHLMDHNLKVRLSQLLTRLSDILGGSRRSESTGRDDHSY
jgi:hypothetical protein